MSRKFFTLNFSKTEFLTKKQLSKIDNSRINTTHFARNLDFIFDEHFRFSDKISSLSKSCYYHMRKLSCIHPYLGSKQPLLSTQNLTIVTVFTTIFQSLKKSPPIFRSLESN